VKSKAEILSLMGGIPEDVYDSICSSFYEESKERAQKMLEALHSADLKSIALLAHGIKGSAGNLHLDTIFSVAKDIEQAARAGDVSKVQQLFPTLKSLLK
jgi:HPt (histidine-containing phosphotransfer) domain-containing protein